MLGRLVLALAMAAMGRAHIALWDEGMYGWDPNDPNQYNPVLPLMHLPFSQWWFHGYINNPPQAGKFLTLPAGGTYHGEVSCNKALTTHGQNAYQIIDYACNDDTATSGTGAMHTTAKMGESPTDDIKGCGVGIAYESDVTKLKPEDFTIISVNYTCPWKRQVDFQIPADLPACPEGGCHCMWGWVHSNDGGAAQNYFLGYRCDVTGAVATRSLPKAKTANKCHYPSDTSNCTVGAKQPHYWYQAEQNNNNQGEYDPPFYNGDYGFMNGAQTDLFAGESSDSTSSTAASSATTPSTSSSIEAAPESSSSSIASTADHVTVSASTSPSSLASVTQTSSSAIVQIAAASISSSSSSASTSLQTTQLAAQASASNSSSFAAAVATSLSSSPASSISKSMTSSSPSSSSSSASIAAAATTTQESSHTCKRRRRIERNLASESGMKRHLERAAKRAERQRRGMAVAVGARYEAV